jgi:hypothetical protein
MSHEREKIDMFPEVKPPRHLVPDILQQINRIRSRRARIRLGLFGVLVLGCLFLFVPVIRYAANEFYASGFYEYLSLVFIDQAVLIEHWKELSYSLLESFPSMAVLLTGVVGGLLVWGLQRIVKNIPAALTVSHA